MNPRFSQIKAASAARLKPSQLSAWLGRGEPIINDERDERCEATGRRMFSAATILQLALACKLVKGGVPARDALLAGMAFVGTNRGYDGAAPRPCGNLWPSETFAIYAGPGLDGFTFAPAEHLAEAIMSDDLAFGAPDPSDRAPTLVVSVNAVRDQVARALGVPAGTLLAPATEAAPCEGNVEANGQAKAGAASMPTGEVVDFLRLNCIRTGAGKIGTRALYDAYKAWCARSGVGSVPHHSFAPAVQAYGSPRRKLDRGRHFFCLIDWAPNAKGAPGGNIDAE